VTIKQPDGTEHTAIRVYIAVLGHDVSVLSTRDGTDFVLDGKQLGVLDD
jgi:hypothetical protein